MRIRHIILTSALVITLAGCSVWATACGSSARTQAEAPASETSSTSLTGPSIDAEKAEFLALVQATRAGIEDGSLIYTPPDDPSAPATAQEWLDALEKLAYAPDVIFYLNDSAGDNPTLYDEVAALPEVAQATFISKAEAVERMEEWFKDDPEIAAQLEGFSSTENNPLPASIEVLLWDYHQASEFAAKLQDRPEVDDVYSSSRDFAALAEQLRTNLE